MRIDVHKAAKPDTLEPKPDWADRLALAFKLISNDQKELGKLFSVHPKTIESWSKGRTEPAFKKLVKIREISGVSLDWIIAGIGRPLPVNSSVGASGVVGAAREHFDEGLALFQTQTAADARHRPERQRQRLRNAPRRDQPNNRKDQK